MIEFPCKFPIKIIANNLPGVADELLSIVRQHHPEFNDTDIEKKTSKNDIYFGLTVTILAQNQEALDALYLDLTKHPQIKMVL